MKYGQSDKFVDPYWAGWQACLDGKGYDENPYVFDPYNESLDQARWSSGYSDCRDFQEN